MCVCVCVCVCLIVTIEENGYTDTNSNLDETVCLYLVERYLSNYSPYSYG